MKLVKFNLRKDFRYCRFGVPSQGSEAVGSARKRDFFEIRKLLLPPFEYLVQLFDFFIVLDLG